MGRCSDQMYRTAAILTRRRRPQASPPAPTVLRNHRRILVLEPLLSVHEFLLSGLVNAVCEEDNPTPYTDQSKRPQASISHFPYQQIPVHKPFVLRAAPVPVVILHERAAKFESERATSRLIGRGSSSFMEAVSLQRLPIKCHDDPTQPPASLLG